MLTVLPPHQPASFKPIEIYEYCGHQNGLQIQFSCVCLYWEKVESNNYKFIAEELNVEDREYIKSR